MSFSSRGPGGGAVLEALRMTTTAESGRGGGRGGCAAAPPDGRRLHARGRPAESTANCLDAEFLATVEEAERARFGWTGPDSGTAGALAVL
jgi:hypothetical protein